MGQVCVQRIPALILFVNLSRFISLLSFTGKVLVKALHCYIGYDIMDSEKKRSGFAVYKRNAVFIF